MPAASGVRLALRLLHAEEQIKAWHRENAESQRLEDIPGIGPLTATALVAAIGNATAFDDARQLAGRLAQLLKRRHSNVAAVAVLKDTAAWRRTDLNRGSVRFWGHRERIQIVERKRDELKKRYSDICHGDI